MIQDLLSLKVTLFSLSSSYWALAPTCWPLQLKVDEFIREAFCSNSGFSDSSKNVSFAVASAGRLNLLVKICALWASGV